MFSERLLDHFENPRNAGKLPDSDLRVRVENPICGDILELSVSISDQRIYQSRFRAKGCVPLMACSSILAEMIEGLTITEFSNINTKIFLANSGVLPQASGHAAEMAVEAIREIVKKLKAR
jgi:nitrogen fixation NifU-like protein